MPFGFVLSYCRLNFASRKALSLVICLSTAALCFVIVVSVVLISLLICSVALVMKFSFAFASVPVGSRKRIGLFFAYWYALGPSAVPIGSALVHLPSHGA